MDSFESSQCSGKSSLVLASKCVGERAVSNRTVATDGIGIKCVVWDAVFPDRVFSNTVFSYAVRSNTVLPGAIGTCPRRNRYRSIFFHFSPFAGDQLD